MIPNLGDIVLYHFSQLENGYAHHRVRPAVVTNISPGNGDHDLHVFWHPTDRPIRSPEICEIDGAVRVQDETSTTVLHVRPHHEPAGEMGRMEKAVAQDYTWTWPPSRWGRW